MRWLQRSHQARACFKVWLITPIHLLANESRLPLRSTRLPCDASHQNLQYSYRMRGNWTLTMLETRCLPRGISCQPCGSRATRVRGGQIVPCTPNHVSILRSPQNLAARFFFSCFFLMFVFAHCISWAWTSRGLRGTRIMILWTAMHGTGAFVQTEVV